MELDIQRNDSVAQDLYDKFKIISYPRTDSRYLTDDERRGEQNN